MIETVDEELADIEGIVTTFDCTSEDKIPRNKTKRDIVDDQPYDPGIEVVDTLQKQFVDDQDVDSAGSSIIKVTDEVIHEESDADRYGQATVDVDEIIPDSKLNSAANTSIAMGNTNSVLSLANFVPQDFDSANVSINHNDESIVAVSKIVIELDQGSGANASLTIAESVSGWELVAASTIPSIQLVVAHNDQDFAQLMMIDEQENTMLIVTELDPISHHNRDMMQSLEESQQHSNQSAVGLDKESPVFVNEIVDESFKDMLLENLDELNKPVFDSKVDASSPVSSAYSQFESCVLHMWMHCIFENKAISRELSGWVNNLSVPSDESRTSETVFDEAGAIDEHGMIRGTTFLDLPLGNITHAYLLLVQMHLCMIEIKFGTIDIELNTCMLRSTFEVDGVLDIVRPWSFLDVDILVDNPYIFRLLIMDQHRTKLAQRCVNSSPTSNDVNERFRLHASWTVSLSNSSTKTVSNDGYEFASIIVMKYVELNPFVGTGADDTQRNVGIVIMTTTSSEMLGDRSGGVPHSSTAFRDGRLLSSDASPSVGTATALTGETMAATQAQRLLRHHVDKRVQPQSARDAFLNSDTLEPVAFFHDLRGWMLIIIYIASLICLYFLLDASHCSIKVWRSSRKSCAQARQFDFADACFHTMIGKALSTPRHPTRWIVGDWVMTGAMIGLVSRGEIMMVHARRLFDGRLERVNFSWDSTIVGYEWPQGTSVEEAQRRGLLLGVLVMVAAVRGVAEQGKLGAQFVTGLSDLWRYLVPLGNIILAPLLFVKSHMCKVENKLYATDIDSGKHSLLSTKGNNRVLGRVMSRILTSTNIFVADPGKFRLLLMEQQQIRVPQRSPVSSAASKDVSELVRLKQYIGIKEEPPPVNFGPYEILARMSIDMIVLFYSSLRTRILSEEGGI